VDAAKEILDKHLDLMRVELVARDYFSGSDPLVPQQKEWFR
jgi:hypothetical protein